MLKKHTGTTEDTKGCEFSYTCYTQIEMAGDKERDDISRKYECNEFPEIKANTLKELKKKMGVL